MVAPDSIRAICDYGEWRNLIREIAHSHMWDSNYDMIDHFEDMPPQQAAVLRA